MILWKWFIGLIADWKYKRKDELQRHEFTDVDLCAAFSVDRCMLGDQMAVSKYKFTYRMF